jgi:hypothetical protein
MLVRESNKGFPPAPSTIDDENNIPFVTATLIVRYDDDDTDRQQHSVVHNLTNTFVHTPPNSSHGWETRESGPNFNSPAVVRMPSNVEQVIMDEPPPPRRRRVGDCEDPTSTDNIDTNSNSSSSSQQQSSRLYHDPERPSLISPTMFDPNPRNPAHMLLWQTGRVSRAALKKTIQLTKELPKYTTAKATVPDIIDLTQRSVSFIKDTSVRSATFVQSKTIHARDRTYDWYQKKDVGTKTKAAIYYLGDQAFFLGCFV